ncbi:DUF4234 domain-containing protein [Clostridium aminobutyricum]|uniref:DUF4234 domain-containing protein n=1 Tax=Clostridium aminobutyricum TaxID=33953 RepID=A0A939DC29_CLOAM|nr:DUF4234 domain-containing protein [Clostridium aminobutyricum]MBN7774513.1 DUF4234 domain-containing protein [Clostridium aminobutyricum]
MREKNIALCILFTIITFGIYGLYWIICLTNDSLELSSERGTNGGWVLIFTIITLGIYGLYWSYIMGDRIYRLRQKHGLAGGSANGALYLIFCLIGFSIIALALMQNEINRFLEPNPSAFMV